MKAYTPDQIERFLSPTQIAAASGLSVQRIKQLLQAGTIAHIPTAVGRLTPVENVQAWAEASGRKLRLDKLDTR